MKARSNVQMAVAATNPNPCELTWDKILTEWFFRYSYSSPYIDLRT